MRYEEQILLALLREAKNATESLAPGSDPMRAKRDRHEPPPEGEGL